MILRQRSFSDGASMARGTLRLHHRRPKGKPMAQERRRWVFPIGAPMAHRRTFGSTATVFAGSNDLFSKSLAITEPIRREQLAFDGSSFAQTFTRAA
jgi:hypothetical protein